MINNSAGASTDPTFGFPGGPAASVSLRTVAHEWMRIGVTGFGGPPGHIALLRRLVVDRKGRMDPRVRGCPRGVLAVARDGLDPARDLLRERVGGVPAAVVGGLGFIVPAVALILAHSALFLGHAPPL